jgi:uncharacterized protein (TIGR00269 family)
MVKPNTRIAFALSGGKDSTVLLHILRKLKITFSRSPLVAITIDEGISDYRTEAIRIARETCDKLQVEHHVYSFQELYGVTLDELATKARRLGHDFICSYCGILRRKALNFAARDVAGSQLATAHNLDDEVQSMVMNLLRGDLTSMSRSNYTVTEEPRLIPRIKPLCEVLEQEVALYAFLANLPFQSFPCKYSETSLRNDVRDFLNTLEEKHPSMKFSLYRTLEKIRPHLSFANVESLGWCELCGEPTTQKQCRACQLLRDLNLQSP